MRTTATLLTLALATFAQETGKESAADIFYKAFWMEQAAGKQIEAFRLYKRVIDQHAGCPEAPRAVLGMARIAHARGEDIAIYVKLLQANYPQARREVEEAKKLANARMLTFDPEIREEDPPSIRKIKSCYGRLAHNLTPPDHEFLVESGTLSHPMLAASLRRETYEYVFTAASILVAQKAKEAYAVLDKALTDGNVLFKTAIIHAIRGVEIDSPKLAKSVAALYTDASPSLRATIAETMTKMVRFEGQTRTIAYALLTRAIADKEDSVRRAALRVPLDQKTPDAYVGARLARMEKRDTIFQEHHYEEIAQVAKRKAYTQRVRAVLVRHQPSGNYEFHIKTGDKGALILAEAGVAWASRKPGSRSVRSAITTACGNSPDAAAWTLRQAVHLKQPSVVEPAARGMLRASWGDQRATNWAGSAAQRGLATYYRKYLGTERADGVVRDALGASFDKDAERRSVAANVISILGLGPQGAMLIVEALKKNRRKGLPGLLYEQSTFEQLPPKQMATVASFATKREEFNRLLAVGRQVYLTNTRAYPDAGAAFFEAVVPKVGPEAVRDLNRIAPRHPTIVALKYLNAKGEEWKWNTRQGPKWSPTVMVETCKQPELLPLTLEATTDERRPVALTAIQVAAQVKTPAATQALVRGLGSASGKVREWARQSLAQRGDEGLDLLVKHVDWDKLDDKERIHALKMLRSARQPRHAQFVGSLLAKRGGKWWMAWETYFAIAPKPAVELALVEAVGKGPYSHRYEAVSSVLARTADKRRIEVFRKLLTSSESGIVRIVVQTISDQYLIELGAEVLEQLRNPDPNIRAAATRAIERLKFYADAKKTFDRREK